LIGHATVISPELATLLDDRTTPILDAGCGPAGVYMVLDTHPVTAIDPLIETYTYWLDHFESTVFPWVDFRNIPLEQFKAREPFELVFCMNALNHVADIRLATEKLVAATSKNGLIVMTLDTHNHSFMQKLFKLIPGDILHPHQYTLRGYIELFKSFGLQLQGKHTLRNGRLFNHELLMFKKT
jgi:2-polyprenyl-6-hydroxyphenyl methylase/3-demethylubiquinone-9 3-methyltransferase